MQITYEAGYACNFSLEIDIVSLLYPEYPCGWKTESIYAYMSYKAFVTQLDGNLAFNILVNIHLKNY